MPVNLMKEETLSSFAIRSLYVSGTIDIERISSRLFPQGRREWKLFPTANTELSKLFNGVIAQKDVDDIVANHTLAPLYQPISNTNFKLFERHRITKPYDKDPRHSMYGSLNSAEILYSNIQYCPLCFLEQVEEFGFSWFKREWQIHKMGTCLEHGCHLIDRCSCGSAGSNVSLIISMFQQYCRSCDSPFSILSGNDTDSTYAAWLRNTLNAHFPTFSAKLRVFLIKESAFKLGLKRSASNNEIGAFLARLYDPFLIEHPSRRPEIWVKGRTAELNYTNRLVRAISVWSDDSAKFKPYDDFIPHTCLFHPLSKAFPIFNDFLGYLNEVTYRTRQENYFGEIEEILELIN